MDPQINLTSDVSVPATFTEGSSVFVSFQQHGSLPNF